MARIDDLPEPTRTVVRDLPCTPSTSAPFVAGPALSGRRVALVSSAALVQPGEAPFSVGAGEAREVPSDASAHGLLSSHVSINFDRTGFQVDPNVVFPLRRLQELAAEGVIGSVASRHFTVMGSTDPAEMGPAIDTMTQALLADRCDAVVFAPV